MHRILPMCLDAAVAALALAYPYVLLNRHRFHDKVRTCWYYLLSVYLCAMFALVGLPDIRYIRFDLRINLMPFRYFFSDRSSLPNVALFVPLGAFLPILWQRFGNWYRSAFFGLCTSLSIELLQIFTFRATDINDLITNTAGTLLGWCIGHFACKAIKAPSPSPKTGDLVLICGTTMGFMIFVHPLLADPVFRLLIG